MEGEEVKEVINILFVLEKLFIWYKNCSISCQDIVL